MSFTNYSVPYPVDERYAKTDSKGTTNPDILNWAKGNPADKSDLRNDIRLALIDFLRKN